MIFIIDQKTWKKKAKKLVTYKDYIIFDATDDETGNLTKYSNVVSASGLCPSNKLIKGKLSEDYEMISKEKLKKMEKNWITSKAFRLSSMAIVKGLLQADGHINLFIVLKNKAYKAYGKKIKKEMSKLFDTKNAEFIYLKEDIEIDKKILKINPNGKVLSTLFRQLSDHENELEKEEKIKKDKKKKNKK